MKKNSANTLLNEEIEQLEIRRAQELILLKAQFEEVKDSWMPINLIKDSLETVTSAPNIKKGIGRSVIGFASSLLIKKIFFRKTHNPLTIAAGMLLQTAAVGLVANNSDKISSIGRKLFNNLFSKFKK